MLESLSEVIFDSLKNYPRWRRAVFAALLIVIVYLTGLSWSWLSVWLGLFAFFEAIGYITARRKW
ncbi:MAG: hypothetical protein ABL907_09585 [Hyphomicrobium sp.]